MSKDIQEISNINSTSRLDVYLSSLIEDISRTKIKFLIDNGKIKVDDYIVKPSYRLKGGESISIDKEIKTSNQHLNIEKQKIPLKIIHEDEDLIVINKSAGLVVHPGSGNKDGTMLNGLLYHFDELSLIDKNRPGIIHRLDKYTTGIIIVAKTDRAHYYLSEQFAQRKIKKVYRAIVWGKMNKEGNVEGNISRDRKKRTIFKLTNQEGRYSYSSYKLLSHSGLFSYIEVYPLTGRTHQIRVHMKSIGHPILLDDSYGGGKDKLKGFNSNYNNMSTKIFSCINRYALHAYSIEFSHPVTKSKMLVKCDIPDDMAKCVKAMNEYSYEE